MNRERILGDDAWRLVDVLLAEELESASAQRRPAAKPRWFAAALVLLGLGVVVGLTIARRQDPDRQSSSAPGQEPRPLTTGELIAQLRDARLRHARLAAVRRYRFERLGNLDLGWDPTADVVGVHAVEDAAAVAELTDLLSKALDDVDGIVPGNLDSAEDLVVQAQPNVLGSGRLVGECVDGRSLVLWTRLGDRQGQPMLAVPSLRVPFADDSALAARLRDLQRRAEEAAWRSHGSVRDANDLERVDAGVRTLHCRALTARDFAAMQRLGSLESLTVRGIVEFMLDPPVRPRQLPDGPLALGDLERSAVSSIAQLRSVRRLELPADALDDQSLRELAAMPLLQSLTLTGRIDQLTGAGFAAFGPRLDELRIVTQRVGPSVSSGQFAAIAALPGLRELWLDVAVDDPAVARSLMSMPQLRRLAISGHGVLDTAQLFVAIGRMRLEKLMLQEVGVTGAAIESLAALPALRELDLRYVSLDFDGAARALATLQQVRRLDVRGSGVFGAAVNDLATALPQCEVIGSSAEERVKAIPIAVPSWSKY